METLDLIDIDTRGRTNLGKHTHGRNGRYTVTTGKDGSITLTPAVIMTEDAYRAMSSPELMQAVSSALATPEHDKVRHEF